MAQSTVPLYGFGGGSGSGATLTVTAPAGATVTVSKDGKAKTKVADSSGVAVFKGLSTGEWTINITDGEQTAQKPVAITADYSTVITFFSATIHVTYPAGAACTATDGVTTLSAPDTGGIWDCVVPNAGTWTVSLDSGFAETVEITQDGEEKTIDKWYLYKSGNEFEASTGGWVATDNRHTTRSGYDASANNVPVFTKNQTDMEIYVNGLGNNGTFGSVKTAQTIDLTHANTLHVDMDGSGAWFHIEIGSAKNGSFDASTFISKMADNQTVSRDDYTVDLSNVSGQHEVVIEMYVGAKAAKLFSINVHNVWIS